MNKLPPDPQHAVLKRIYPWEEYDITLVLQWLYAQANKTGFKGTFEDFKSRYGLYVESTDPQDIYDLIENYTGTYRIKPLVSIEQVLHTKDKVLNEDIIVEAIPDDIAISGKKYNGQYQVTPRINLDQILRTKEKFLEDDIVIEKIPYAEVSNTAGGTTVIIG